MLDKYKFKKGFWLVKWGVFGGCWAEEVVMGEGSGWGGGGR